jgi:hypothetical protein
VRSGRLSARCPLAGRRQQPRLRRNWWLRRTAKHVSEPNPLQIADALRQGGGLSVRPTTSGLVLPNGT